MIINGVIAIVSGVVLTIWLAENPNGAPWWPGVVLAVIGVPWTVHGLVRVRWWIGARRIATEWIEEHGGGMPDDLRWLS